MVLGIQIMFSFMLTDCETPIKISIMFIRAERGRIILTERNKAMIDKWIAEATECDFKVALEVKKTEKLAQKRQRICQWYRWYSAFWH